MLLDEQRSKELFAKAGIAVPDGVVIYPDTIETDKPSFPLPWFLKAQVLTGGRGKAGGILRVDNDTDYSPTAEKLFSTEIKGHTIPMLRVESGTDIVREFYFSFTVSREKQAILMTVGREGGVEIENLGADNLLVQEITPPAGLRAHQIRAAFFHMGLEKALLKDFYGFVTSLYDAVVNNGLLMAEVNPLVLTGDNTFLALDGKVEVDDNFVETTPDMEHYYVPAHHAPEENFAREAGLSFVRLKGWCGLMVNGAGLAMATMDALNLNGLSAANFLDLGGGADEARMRKAMQLLFGDEQVEALFINLFGGILSCRKVAEALAGALDGKAPHKPIVVRMSGFEAEAGLNILNDLSIEGIHIAETMESALEKLKELKPSTHSAVDFSAVEVKDVDLLEKLPATSSSELFNITKETRILVQGMTGKEGQLHTGLMQEYGSNIVAGVTPFKGGQEVLGVPVYSSVEQALKEHRVDATIIFVPPRMAADAIMEAVQNGIEWCICITEGIPQHEMLAIMPELKKSKTKLIGPNTPGIIVPGQCKIGILPAAPFSSGPVAILSRSGTLTYEVAARLNEAGIGQSMCAGIGGDPFIGMRFADMFELLRNHDETKAVVMLGEIGGQAEEELAEFVVKTGFDKPVFSFIAGQTAPPGKRLGHAGAILEKGGGIESKLTAMKEAGFYLCPTMTDIPVLVKKVLDGE
ncbi:MAG: succinate--CoA ligase subunit alpha [Desulfovibrio sp.]